MERPVGELRVGHDDPLVGEFGIGTVVRVERNKDVLIRLKILKAVEPAVARREREHG